MFVVDDDDDSLINIVISLLLIFQINIKRKIDERFVHTWKHPLRCP